MKTALQELIEKLEHTKMNSCKHTYEMFFFDGVLAIIEGGDFLKKEKHQIFEAVKYGFNDANRPLNSRDVSFANYYEKTFE